MTDAISVGMIAAPLAKAMVARAITAVERRLTLAANGLRRGDANEALAVAQELDTYAVAEKAAWALLTSPDKQTTLPGVSVRDAMIDLEIQAIVHELLLTRILRRPEVEVLRLEQGFHHQFVSIADESASPQCVELAIEVFGLLDRECTHVSELVQKASPDIVQRIEQNAAYAGIYSTLQAIERHLDSTNTASDATAIDSGFESKYRGIARAKHGYITPPDFDRKKSVPLEELYVSPEIYPNSDTLHQGAAVDLLGMWDTTERSVLLGEPGGGKSTAMGALAHHLASNPQFPVPFLVILRDFAQFRESQSIVEYIETRLRTYYQCVPPEGYVERRLLSGSAAVLFDGLDELLDTSARREITDVVENFVTLYPLARVLVTSRAVGYSQAPLASSLFSTFGLSNFSDDRVADYVRRWFAVSPDIERGESSEFADAFLEESAGVSDIRTNPLMLALMCIIFRGPKFIPRNRPEVYERCAKLLFEQWDGHRSINANIQAQDYLDDALKHIALWMFTEDSSEGVSRSRLVEVTTQYLADRAFEDAIRCRKAAEEFVDFCMGRAWVFTDAGTTADGEPLFKFTHRTFLEYFGASELVRRHDGPEKLARSLLPRIARQEWDMLGQLAVAISGRQSKDGADRVLTMMLEERRRRSRRGRDSVLSFVARCSGFAMPRPVTVRKMTREILDSALHNYGPNLSLGSLLANAQVEQYSYIDDEFREAVRRALSEASEEQSFRVFATVLAIEYSDRTVSRFPARGAWVNHFTDLRNSICRDHFAELLESCRQGTHVRVAAFRAEILSPHEFSIMCAEATSTGRELLLDAYFMSLGGPYFRHESPIVITLIRNFLHGGSQGRYSCLLEQVALGLGAQSSPPWLHRNERFWLHFDDSPGGDLLRGGTPSAHAAIVLWCCMIEWAFTPDEQLFRTVEESILSNTNVEPLRSLLQCRSGVEVDLTPYSLPQSVLEWASSELHFTTRHVERIGQGPDQER